LKPAGNCISYKFKCILLAEVKNEFQDANAKINKMTGKLVEIEGKRLTIMDTTLRDGEQTTGVSFSEGEKLSVAKVLLEDVRVDRIEIASARVSEGEFKGAQRVFAGQQKKDTSKKLKSWVLLTATFR
jgi:hypothetical protein